MTLDTPSYNLISENRINVSDFSIVKTIGRGAFGKVQLVNTYWKIHI